MVKNHFPDFTMNRWRNLPSVILLLTLAERDSTLFMSQNFGIRAISFSIQPASDFARQ
jgi:hypothetical protein